MFGWACYDRWCHVECARPQKFLTTFTSGNVEGAMFRPEGILTENLNLNISPSRRPLMETKNWYKDVEWKWRGISDDAKWMRNDRWQGDKNSYLWIGDSGNKSRLSDTDELGLGVVSGRAPFLISSTFFFTRPLRFSNLLVSIEAALLRTDFPGFASGLIIHQDDFPVPSFCTRMKRLWSDKLCRIEFWKKHSNQYSILMRHLHNTKQILSTERCPIYICYTIKNKVFLIKS